MNWCVYVLDALACAKSCSQLQILRVPAWIFLTRCTRSLEIIRQLEGLHGSEGRSFSLGGAGW
jgi:hypothetical protein